MPVTLVYCGQTVEWIKMPLGTEVGLGLGHIVLDGDPAPLPLPKGAQQRPTFRPMYIVAISATAELFLFLFFVQIGSCSLAYVTIVELRLARVWRWAEV